MRYSRPNHALALVGVLATMLYGCQQGDQKLPFELDPAQGQTTSLGPNGGVLSLPPGFSMEFFSGTLTGSELVTAAQRLTAFPNSAGLVLPGTAYDVGPAGTSLSPSAPARVEIAVPAALLGAGDELSLSLALLQPGGSIVTDVTSYDVSNGILTAYVEELGPVAAVVATDVLSIGDLADLPELGGGAIAPASPPAPAGDPAPAPPTRPDGVVFFADCSPGERSCLTSGIAKIWVGDEAQARLGDDLVLVNTTVDANIEFFAFDPLNSLPDSAVGYVRVDGDLRARINSVVSSRKVGDEVALHTGNGSDANNPDATAISLGNGTMTFEFTSQGDPEVIEYAVSGVGTSELLTIQIEGYLTFQNADGSTTLGDIVAHVRLRR